jgi:hypothetical protein
MTTQVPQVATISFTDAQIKTLPTTGTIVIPAPGVGKAIMVLGSFWRIDTTAGTYTNLNGIACRSYLQYETGDRITAINDENIFPFWSTGDVRGVALMAAHDIEPSETLGHYPFGIAEPITQFENNAVTLRFFNNEAGNLTGGHANNTLRLSVVYIEIDV